MFPLHKLNISKCNCLLLSKDVEALEGYADALTEVGGLTPEHHQAIATKLALDLMEDLDIDKKDKSHLLEKETAFIKDAEIAYIRGKYIVFHDHINSPSRANIHLHYSISLMCETFQRMDRIVLLVSF